MDKTSCNLKKGEIERCRLKNSSANAKLSKVNCRTSKKRSVIERKETEKRNYPLESTEDEDDDTLSDCSSDQVGLCVTCNLAIVKSNKDPYIQRPLLCSRCIKRLDSQTDVSCTFCQTDCQSYYSQVSNDCYNNEPNTHSTRTYSMSQASTKTLPRDASSKFFIQAPSMDVNHRYATLSKINSIFDCQTTKNDMKKKTRMQNNAYQMIYQNMLSKEESLISDFSDIKINLECSRRPIRCPRLDCAMNVAFSALTHHFLFDHPEVPVISVDPGMKSTVVFGYSTVAYDSSRCLALLLVSHKLTENAAKLFNGSQIHAKYRNRLPLPVLAARLRRKSVYSKSNGTELNDAEEGDVIIIWMAGLDVGSSSVGTLLCSIQAIDDIGNESVRSLTYSGPINCLRSAQSPKQVLTNGDCLILHEGFIKNVTSGHANLNVNFIVH